MSWLVKLALAANLLIATALVFAYPHLMVSPGPLINGHDKLASDCFACHSPLLGVASERCTACHKPAQIGQFTTTGEAIVKQTFATPFHQSLVRQDCIACHSDHVGVMRYRRPVKFAHQLLPANSRTMCQSCHKAPVDNLHRLITAECSVCHGQERWKPAAFDHAKYFLLDRDHNVACGTCHSSSDFRQYSCYGCHEHTEANIAHKHRKENIRDFSNCVRCHKSAREHGGEGDRRRGHDD